MIQEEKQNLEYDLVVLLKEKKDTLKPNAKRMSFGINQTEVIQEKFNITKDSKAKTTSLTNTNRDISSENKVPKNTVNIPNNYD
jgi:hypothetical protein